MTVTVEWFGCATFRVRVGDLTLFFDTYLDKAPDVPAVGLAAGEVDDADFLFISHAHFDHVLGADLIARATGATVVGNHEVAHLMADNGVPAEQVLAVSGGETVDCGNEVRVRVLPALHSCLFAASGAHSGASCLGDLGVSAQERQQRVAGLNEVLPTLSEPIRAYFDHHEGHASHRDGGQLAYVLETPAGSLLVSASSGYWHGIFAAERPDFAILAAAGRPNVDGEPHQGSMGEFLVQQTRLLGSPQVILCHHDPLLPPIIGAFDVTDAEVALRAELGDRYRVLQYGEPFDLLA
ncbi:hypothetical protein BH10ACT1_BH10ACT1_01330 [soil metagenome]